MGRDDVSFWYTKYNMYDFLGIRVRSCKYEFNVIHEKFWLQLNLSGNDCYSIRLWFSRDGNVDIEVRLRFFLPSTITKNESNNAVWFLYISW